MQTKNRIFFIVSIVLFAVCIGINAYSSIDYYSMYSTQFTNIDNQFLSARYLESQNGKGVFIAGDLGHNKGELSMIVHEFSRRGYGIWIFDFPSQGLSKGTIPFMYKEPESRYLAEQFYSSIVAYTQLADMPKESIHMIGFGEGARAMLEAAALNDVRTADMTLIGTDINLTEKVNFDFLSFTNDSDLEWVKSLSLHNPGMKIHLIASKIDRASKINDNKELMKKLTAAQSSGSNEETVNTVELTEFTLIPHNSLMSSSSVLSAVLKKIDPDNPDLSLLTRLRFPLEILTNVFFILSIYFAGTLIQRRDNPMTEPDRKKISGLLKSKLYVHLPSLLTAALIAVGLYLLPISFPYFRVFYIVLIAAYGFVMLFMYKFTTFSNNLGANFTKKDSRTRLRWILLNSLIVLAALTAIGLSRGELFLSFIVKPVWFVILILLFIPLFYVDERERRLFSRDTKFCIKLMGLNYLIVLVLPFVCLAAGIFDSTFIVISIAGCLAVTLSTEFITRPLGFSSSASAVLKSLVFVLLSFPEISLFY